MNHIVVIEDEDEEGEKEETRSWEVGEEEEESRLVPRRVARKGTKRARTSSSRLKDKTTINVAITTAALPQTTPTAPQNLRIREDEPPTTTPTISTTRSHARRSAKTPRTEDDAKTTTTTTTTTSSSSAAEGSQLDSAVCPICGHRLGTQDSARINQHIDECLTRSMLIQERDAHNADRTAALAAPPAVHPPPHLSTAAAAVSASALGFAPSMPDARDAGRATTVTPLAAPAVPVPPVRALGSKICPCPYGCGRVLAFDKLGKHARDHHAGDGQALECPICVSVTGLAGVVEEDLLEHLNVNHDPRYAAKQSKHRRARGRGVHSWKPPASDGRYQPAAAVVGAAVLGSASAASPSPLTIRLPQAAMLINSVGTTAHHHDPSAMAASGSVANAFAAQPFSALLASTPTQTSAEFATTRVLVAELPEDKAECPICFENLTIGTKVSYLQCLCIFHECCIQAWWDKHKQLECPTHLQD